MSHSLRTWAIAFMCLATGVLIGRVLPTASGLGESADPSAIKKLVIQHLTTETVDFAPGSDVDVVFETVDPQPDGKIMVIGFCRLVAPKPGGINSGRFWLEVIPQGDHGGYEVRNISCQYGVSQEGFPWIK